MRIALACLTLILLAASAVELIARGRAPDPLRDLRIAETPEGTIGWRGEGDGPPVIVIHGAGGGADQGLLLSRSFLPPCIRAVAPARFGYPGSPLPADASPAAQADAIAALMDALGIERAGILGMSGGVPPALQLAIRHPGRVRGLLLLSSAPHGEMRDPAAGRGAPGWAFDAAFALEAPFAAVARWRPDLLHALFDARSELLAEATAEDRALVDALVAAFRPVRGRRAGLGNEGSALGGDYPLERIAAPTVVVHARDDGINPFEIGRIVADRVPGARFVPFDRGGHLLLGHAAEVRRLATPLLAPCQET